jgi:hypothetical protein
MGEAGVRMRNTWSIADYSSRELDIYTEFWSNKLQATEQNWSKPIQSVSVLRTLMDVALILSVRMRQ